MFVIVTLEDVEKLMFEQDDSRENVAGIMEFIEHISLSSFITTIQEAVTKDREDTRDLVDTSPADIIHLLEKKHPLLYQAKLKNIAVQDTLFELLDELLEYLEIEPHESAVTFTDPKDADVITKALKEGVVLRVDPVML